MICRICGTQYSKHRCPHCGAKPGDEPITASATAQASKERAATLPKPTIRMADVFGPAIALLLPLAYLFVDLFVALPSALLQYEGGVTRLSLLFERLTSSAYVTNTWSELLEGTLGTDAGALQTVSLRTVLTGGAESFAAPVFTVAGFAVLSALMGLVLLFSGGRALHAKWIADLALLGGIGATAAPLVGSLLMRVTYCVQNGGFHRETLAAADVFFTTVGLSVESMLLMALSACLLLPVLASLRRTAARAQGARRHVTLPYRLFACRSFGFTKLLAILTVLLSLALAVSFALLPIATFGGLWDFGGAWQNMLPDFIAAAKAAWGLITGDTLTGALPTLLAPLLGLAFFLQLPLLAVAVWRLLGLLLRLLRVRVEALSERKCDYRTLADAGKRVRRMVLLPFRSYVIVQAILALLILFASGVAAHLDFAQIEGTLGIVYFVIAFVRAIGGVTMLYTLLACAGALLWHSAENLCAALVQMADRHATKKKE